MKPMFTDLEISQYKRDGYLFVSDFCSAPEVKKLMAIAEQDAVLRKNSFDLDDQTGKKTKLSLWYTPGNNPFGYLTRSERMVNRVKQLTDGDGGVCHYHSKLMQKEPRVGGAWEWHQDYGYWYKNQFMFPDQLISVMVALTAANKANGCLQVIRGSHQMGRVNHGYAGEQVGADMTMVENALKTMDLVYCELKPGDALFFHSNLLHRSEANLSENSRWSVISCYSRESNIAYNEPSHTWNVPLEVLPDAAILQKEAESFASAEFLKKENDRALKN
ncbi:MAG TPA: phytanoyl-CoA dioxygenase family protein [Cyclobacteriaceae bacterium]|nr:phytanoyl-CoA dioxygenase family protein [Cyclobacteriaceae bacterium]